MRILFTTGSKASILNYTLELCVYLEKMFKVEICLITTESVESKVHFPPNIKVIHSNLNTIWQNDFNLFIKNINELDRLTSNIIKDFNPDIVHFNHIGLNALGKPNLLHFHDDILNQVKWQEKRGRNYPYLKMHKQFRHFVLNNINKYDCILTTSRFCALNIHKTYNVEKPFKVISNSINPIDVKQSDSKREIVTVLDEYNRKNALKMLCDLKSRLPYDIKISVIADRAQSILNGNNIKHIDINNLEETEKAFQNSSIYLALGNWDYFNYYPLTASLRNCSILANDIPLYREYWSKEGVLFERNNLGSLMKNINNLLENLNLNIKVANNCKQKTLSSCSLKVNASKYFNLYAELIKQKKHHLQNV